MALGILNLFTSSISTLKLLLDKTCNVCGKIGEILRLGTAGILCGWALQEYVAIEHCSQASGGGRGQHRL